MTLCDRSPIPQGAKGPPGAVIRTYGEVDRVLYGTPNIGDLDAVTLCDMRRVATAGVNVCRNGAEE